MDSIIKNVFLQYERLISLIKKDYKMTINENFQKIVELYQQGKSKDAIILIDKEMLIIPKANYSRKEGLFIIDFKKNYEIHYALDKILELNMKDAEILARKSFLLELEMNHEKAKDFANKALDISSKNKLALQTIGTIYFHNGEFEKALEYYEKILSQDKNNSTVLFCKAIALELNSKDGNNISPIFNAFNFDSLDEKSLDSLVIHIINSCGKYFPLSKANKTLESEPKNKLALKIKKLCGEDQNKTRSKIFEIYNKHVHRDPDSEGLNYFEEKISEGRTFQWIEETLANSEEGKNYWN